jgi:hypothetical protein
MAVGEEAGASGRDFLTALAVSHEMSRRIGRAMDYLRGTKDGNAALPHRVRSLREEQRNGQG